MSPSTRPATGPHTLTIAEATDLVGEGAIRVITSDVFDTIVWRPVAEPHHLFVLLARRLRIAGHLADWIDDQTFALARVRAEHLARKQAKLAWNVPECTIEEIWDRISPSLLDAEFHSSSGIELELELEAEALQLHSCTVDLLQAGRRRQVPVTLVSDTYFSVAQLRTLLEKAGLATEGIEITTSSERRRGKYDGLLDDVIEQHGGPAGVLHIGDNPVADVEVGHRAGVMVCHVDVLDEDDAVAAAHLPWTRRSAAIGSDGGRSAAVRQTLVTAGTDGRDPSYQFGAAVAGPIMVGFAGWASATAHELGAGAIHCLLREGARIAELIDVIDPGGPERRLVHASRWAIMRAAVIEGTPTELERALSRRANLTAAHVSDAFGCDADEVETLLGTRVVPRHEQLQAFEALARDRSLVEQIVARSQQLRIGTMRYLERTLRLDGGPLVLCDIGWGGTIQEGLTDILGDAGYTPDVIGLYAMLSPPGEHRVAGGARLLGYLPTIGADGAATVHAAAAVRHPEFLERINTPATGTLLDFTTEGEPVCRPDDHDAISTSLRLSQRGVLDFCRTMADAVLTDPQRRAEWFIDRKLATSALESLATVITTPDPRLAAALGTWEHDDVAGTSAESLSSDSLRRWISYANPVDTADITMHDTFWVAGVAGAAESALASGITALANGGHPDTLCPKSPTGTARLAVFQPGSSLASAQNERVPRLSPGGWMLMQLNTPVAGLRSIRFDAGEVDLLLEVDDVQVVAGVGGANRVLVDSVDELRAASHWVHGRWLGGGHAAVAADGHLLIDLAPLLAGVIDSVSISIGLRTWALDHRTFTQLIPPWRAKVEPTTSRIKRRLGLGSTHPLA